MTMLTTVRNTAKAVSRQELDDMLQLFKLLYATALDDNDEKAAHEISKSYTICLDEVKKRRKKDADFQKIMNDMIVAENDDMTAAEIDVAL